MNRTFEKMQKYLLAANSFDRMPATILVMKSDLRSYSIFEQNQ